MTELLMLIKWLWSNKGVIGIGALIFGLCILFGAKEIELGKSRLDLATAHASIATLNAAIGIQNGEVARLGEDTAAQRLEVDRLLKLVKPKADSITRAADAATARIKMSIPIIKQDSGCNSALFDAAKDMDGLK